MSSRHRNWCKVSDEERYFPWNEGKSQPENFAMLCVDGDPYAAMVDIMMDTKLCANRGVTISTIEEGGTKKYVATINVTDPKRIFQMAHMVQSGELDVTEVTGVNALLNAASNHVGDTNSADADAVSAQALQRIMEQSRATSLEVPTALTVVPTEEQLDSEDWGAETGRRSAVRRVRRPVRVEEEDDEEPTPRSRDCDRDEEEDEDAEENV